MKTKSNQILKQSYFIEKYNRDKNSLSNQAIATVAETQDSLNQRRSGSIDTVTLENTTQKKYYVIEEDNNYYLIPHSKIKIHEYNINTLQSLFECSNFTYEYSDFQLVEPAIVTQLSSELWQLEKKGKLEFIEYFMTKSNETKNIVVTQGFVDKLIDKIGKILKEQHALVERDEEQAEEIESLLNKISSIENDFEELTKSLAKGSYPLKLARSIKAASSSIKPHIVPVDLTKAQLIATYNELVAVLSGYIIPVTLTSDSYRGSNADQIILETTVKGNYWAITTLENKQHKYWLSC